MSTDASKPQISNNPTVATDSIVTGNDQSVTDPRPKRTTRAVNQYGVKVISGSTTADAGFFEAVMSVFENFISYQPVAVALCIVAILHYTAEMGGYAKTHGPFVLMANATKKTHGTMTTAIGKSFAATMYGLFNKMNGAASFFGLVCAYLWPYLCKPSNRNGVLLGILFMYAYVSGLNAAAILATSFGFFLFITLRSPKHKAIVLLVVVLTCYISADTLGKLTGIK